MIKIYKCKVISLIYEYSVGDIVLMTETQNGQGFRIFNGSYGNENVIWNHRHGKIGESYNIDLINSKFFEVLDSYYVRNKKSLKYFIDDKSNYTIQKLTSEKVHQIMLDSLYDSESTNYDDAILVEGITMNIGFNPVKLNSHYDEIIGLLNELPEQFHEEIGGGWSFLEACVDKNGNHWGEHRNMEELFLLGMAIEKVIYLFPREMWCILPGGVPYLMIKKDEEG